MRKFSFIFILLIIFSLALIAQTPDKMSYQMVIRDADNQLIENSDVGIKIEILENDASGTVVFEETHTITSNENGLVSFEIGGGNIESGNIGEIEWGDDIYFLQTSVDPEGGVDYSIVNSSQMLSVPYAQHASSLKTNKTVEAEAGITNPEKTGSANLVPIAYGMIDDDGSIFTSTDNFTVNHTSAGVYEINIEY